MVKILKAFGYAMNGIAVAFKEQLNIKIHFAAVAIVVAAGIWLHLDTVEWSILFLTFGMVIVAEMLNTALEYLVDLVSPHHHPLAGKVKDVAAGAVLIAAIFAVMVAMLIFGNRFLNQVLQINF